MKKPSVEVAPVAGGWEVRSTVGKPGTTFYRSKIDAVLAAWELAPDSDVLIRASTGEILRFPKVKPTGDPKAMLAAVIEAARRSEAKSSR